MTKKILSFFFALLLLCACSQKPAGSDDGKEEENQVTIEEYIDPVKDVFIFGELSEELQEGIKEANCNEEYKNYQFKMLGTKVFDGSLEDINGRKVRLADLDRFYLEIVSVNCSHCKAQLSVMKGLAQGQDIPFVQYFNVGSREDIFAMYEEQGTEISGEMILLPEDEGMKGYVKNILGIKSYPTLITFDQGKVTFDAVGEVNESSFAAISRYGFEDPIRREDLKDAEGRDLLKLSRSVDDVKNDLSMANVLALEELDNDDFTCDLTYRLMGQKLDFDHIINDHSEFYFEQVEDYNYYKDKKLVLLYTYLRDNAQTDKVEFINSLLPGHDDVEFIVVLVEGMESSSAALRNMKIGFNCPVVSVLARMPEDFFDFGINAYPTAVFVDRGTFTGGYSAVEDKEKFDRALKLFLSNACIAYRSNN